MKKNIKFIIIFFSLLTCQSEFGTASSCQLSYQGEGNATGEPLGPAKIFGDPVTIPEFYLRFINRETKEVVIPSKIGITYDWKWLEYPYPERPWGVWSTAYDRIDCVETSPEILVPKYNVQPRGWYNGKYVKFPFIGKQPSFTGIGIILYDVGCSRTLRIEILKKEVSKLKSNKIITVEINCTGNSTVTIR